MSFRPRPKYAAVNPHDPSAWGTCDRCGLLGNLRNFRWDEEWAGPQIQNRRYLVHQHCYNIPNELLRTIVLPTDPDPIVNARIEPYGNDEGVGLRVEASRHGLRVALTNGTRRPLITVGTTNLQTSF